MRDLTVRTGMMPRALSVDSSAGRLPRVLIATLVVLALAGCSRGVTSTPGEAPNLETWVAEVKARPAPALDPLPVMQQFETFEYAAQGLVIPSATHSPTAAMAAGRGLIRTVASRRSNSSRSTAWTWSERWAMAVPSWRW